ncbi:hypothetical protein ACFQX7_27135 [Luedemannella flava]
MIITPRRIPLGAERDILMRCYGYRLTRTSTVMGADPSYAAADVAAARGAGWPVRQPERWSAREVVERADEAATALNEDAVLAAFVAGMSSAPRGRQTIISYGWARFLRASAKRAGDVPDCGLEPATDVDVTEVLLRLALGWAWNEIPNRYLPDLEAATSEGLPEPDAQDRAQLRALLDLIRSSPTGTIPSALEKRLARAKLLPGTDKYQRYGILIGLSEYGVLPSPVLPPMWDRFIPTAERHAASRTLRGPRRSRHHAPARGVEGGIDEYRAARLLAL